MANSSRRENVGPSRVAQATGSPGVLTTVTRYGISTFADLDNMRVRPPPPLPFLVFAHAHRSAHPKVGHLCVIYHSNSNRRSNRHRHVLLSPAKSVWVFRVRPPPHYETLSRPHRPLSPHQHQLQDRDAHAIRPHLRICDKVGLPPSLHRNRDPRYSSVVIASVPSRPSLPYDPPTIYPFLGN